MSEERGRILGIGGIFFKGEDHKTLRKWYADRLGIGDGGDFAMFQWRPLDADVEHMTVWSLFPPDTKHFPATQACMINYVVDDLDALLAKLTAAGVTIDPKQQSDEFGKFAWIYDPAGAKIELWQPAAS